MRTFYVLDWGRLGIYHYGSIPDSICQKGLASVARHQFHISTNPPQTQEALGHDYGTVMNRQSTSKIFRYLASDLHKIIQSQQVATSGVFWGQDESSHHPVVSQYIMHCKLVQHHGCIICSFFLPLKMVQSWIGSCTDEVKARSSDPKDRTFEALTEKHVQVILVQVGRAEIPVLELAVKTIFNHKLAIRLNIFNQMVKMDHDFS